MSVNLNTAKKGLIICFFGSCILCVLSFFVGIWSEVDKFNYTGLLFLFIAVISLFALMLVADILSE